MLIRSLAGCLLVAATVFVHAAGLSWMLKRLGGATSNPPTRFWPINWLLIRITWMLLLIHTLEVAVWGLFYFWSGAFPDAADALYFSGVTYATVGYGDFVLPERWRILGPVEGLTGILMCGLSTGLFFAVVSRLFVDPLKLKG